jgi:pimeloyl-ACP methyl ester carboxylesterase
MQATVETNEESVWFGPPDNPLYGRLRKPIDERIRGGVVLVPTIGREVHMSRYALRTISALLGAQGFLTLRMDFIGTGDSGGTIEEGNVDVMWRDNVSSAVALLRHSGVTNISVIGMRLGATVAGVAAIQCDLQLSSLVLWDPCESGRRFLRESAALEALHQHDPRVNEGKPYETSEFALSPERAEELGRLNLAKSGPGKFADRVLILTRVNREVSDALKNRLSEADVEWAVTDEQEAMLGASDQERSIIASHSLQLMTRWLSDTPAQWTRMEPLPTRDSQLFRERSGPFEVMERAVEIGENHVFSLLSEPVGPSHGPLIVMTNVANEDHTGPSRQWVELARRWSSYGLRCVRFDPRGVGESPWSNLDKPYVYENEWIDDVTSLAPFFSADDPSNVVYVGLSSGVYLAVVGAIKYGARGLCAINPPVAMDSLQLIVRLRRSSNHIVHSIGDRLLTAMMDRPWAVAGLWQVGRVVLRRHLSRDLLATAVDRGVDVLVLASPADVSPVPHIPILRSIDRRRIQSPRNYQAVFVPELDHSMHSVDGRRRTVAMLDHFILQRMGGIDSFEET